MCYIGYIISLKIDFDYCHHLISSLKLLSCFVDHFVFCIKVMCLYWSEWYLVISILLNSSIKFVWNLRFPFCSKCCWLSFLRFASSEDFNSVSLCLLLLQINLKFDISYCTTGDTLAKNKLCSVLLRDMPMLYASGDDIFIISDHADGQSIEWWTYGLNVWNCNVLAILCGN